MSIPSDALSWTDQICRCLLQVRRCSIKAPNWWKGNINQTSTSSILCRSVLLTSETSPTRQ